MARQTMKPTYDTKISINHNHKINDNLYNS